MQVLQMGSTPEVRFEVGISGGRVDTLALVSAAQCTALQRCLPLANTNTNGVAANERHQEPN